MGNLYVVYQDQLAPPGEAVNLITEACSPFRKCDRQIKSSFSCNAKLKPQNLDSRMNGAAVDDIPM